MTAPMRPPVDAVRTQDPRAAASQLDVLYEVHAVIVSQDLLLAPNLPYVTGPPWEEAYASSVVRPGRLLFADHDIA